MTIPKVSTGCDVPLDLWIICQSLAIDLGMDNDTMLVEALRQWVDSARDRISRQNEPNDTPASDPALRRRPVAVEQVIQDACDMFHCKRRDVLILKTQVAVIARRWAIRRLGSQGLPSFKIAHYLNIRPHTVLKNLKTEAKEMQR